MSVRQASLLPSLALTLTVMALGPCAQGSDAEGGPLLARGGVASRSRSTGAEAHGGTVDEAPAEPAPAPVTAPRPPRVQAPLREGASPLHSRIGPREVAHMQEVLARSDRRLPDVFAKMGGSSIASQAFLHCFATDDVELGTHTELASTLEYFRNGRAQRQSPFARESLATAVGWSLRQGLGGRPPRVIREVHAVHPRYALAFFGGNDVQARNPRTFGQRMIDLVDLLEAQGVVPILGATLPRRDSRQMDEWARRYNRISAGIAQARGLPYVDFHQAFAGLPALGLARDGVHPNVYRDGRSYAPCHLDEEGLQHGQNVRNLMTLEALDRVRRALDETSGGPLDPPVAAPWGRGTLEDPVRVERLPFAEIFPVEEASSRELDDYGGCWRAQADGPERVYRIVADAPTALEVTALGAGRLDAEAYLVDAQGDPASCVKGGRGDMHVEVPPGTWHLVVEVHPERRARDLDGDVLFVVTPAL